MGGAPQRSGPLPRAAGRPAAGHGLSPVPVPGCPQELEQQGSIYTKGCVGQFEKWLQDNLIVVAGVFVGIALLQVPWVLPVMPHSLTPGHPTSGLSLTSSSLTDLWYLPGPEPGERHQGSEGQLVRPPHWPGLSPQPTQGPATVPWWARLWEVLLLGSEPRMGHRKLRCRAWAGAVSGAHRELPSALVVWWALPGTRKGAGGARLLAWGCGGGVGPAVASRSL